VLIILITVSKIYYFVQVLLILSFFFDGICENAYSFPHKSIALPGFCVNFNEDTLPEIEKVFIRYGLVNVKDIDESVKVDLRYSASGNFMGKSLYGNLKNAYLQRDVAEMLVIAQKNLRAIFPHYSLVILDAARPASIQEKMWKESALTYNQKSRFLSSPQVGSLHSYGAAVDVTIADGKGNYLDMGTEFDAFDELSYTVHEKSFEKEGKLTGDQLSNRMLLRMVMKKAGFSTIETEWWHFNAMSRTQAQNKYPLIVSHEWNKNHFPEKQVSIKPTAEKSIHKTNIVFRVQVKTSTKPLQLSDTVFKGQQVTRYKHEGLYKYTSGEFKNLDEARELKNKLCAMGFSDAFVAAFNNGKRIGIMDAVELMNESK